MPLALGDPEHWRQRAEEARRQAEEIKDPGAKRAMLGIAESYELIAQRAAEAKVHTST